MFREEVAPLNCLTLKQTSEEEKECLIGEDFNLGWHLTRVGILNIYN